MSSIMIQDGVLTDVIVWDGAYQGCTSAAAPCRFQFTPDCFTVVWLQVLEKTVADHDMVDGDHTKQRRKVRKYHSHKRLLANADEVKALLQGTRYQGMWRD